MTDLLKKVVIDHDSVKRRFNIRVVIDICLKLKVLDEI